MSGDEDIGRVNAHGEEAHPPPLIARSGNARIPFNTPLAAMLVDAAGGGITRIPQGEPSIDEDPDRRAPPLSDRDTRGAGYA